MAQSKLHKNVIVLAKALLALFMTGNKPFHLVANTGMCLYLFDDVPSHNNGL